MKRRARDHQWRRAQRRAVIRMKHEFRAAHIDRMLHQMFWGTGSPDAKPMGILDLQINAAQKRVFQHVHEAQQRGEPVRVFFPKARSTNYFYETWQRQLRGESEYPLIFLPWFHQDVTKDA